MPPVGLFGELSFPKTAMPLAGLLVSCPFRRQPCPVRGLWWVVLLVRQLCPLWDTTLMHITISALPLARLDRIEFNFQSCRLPDYFIGFTFSLQPCHLPGARCLESTDLVPGDRRTSLLVVDAALTPDTTLILRCFLLPPLQERLLER